MEKSLHALITSVFFLLLQFTSQCYASKDESYSRPPARNIIFTAHHGLESEAQQVNLFLSLAPSSYRYCTMRNLLYMFSSTAEDNRCMVSGARFAGGERPHESHMDYR
jgi:hypothetical protein